MTPGSPRITPAVLGEKIDTLTANVAQLTVEVNLQRRDTDNRLRQLEQFVAKAGVLLDRLDELEEEVKEVRHKNSFWSGINTALTLFGSIIAGVVGYRN